MRVEYVNCILFIRDIERERESCKKLVTSTKTSQKKVQHNTLHARAQKQKQKQNRAHVSDDTVVVRKGRQDDEEEEQKEETKE